MEKKQSIRFAAQQFRLSPTLDFLRLLWAIDHGLHSVSKHLSATIGVTAPQRAVLRLVGDNPKVLATDLAVLLHLDPGTLSGIVRRLEEKGLLTRTRDALDRRRAHLELTPAGQHLNTPFEGSVEARVATVLQQLTPQEIATTRAVLVKVAEALRTESLAPDAAPDDNA